MAVAERTLTDRLVVAAEHALRARAPALEKSPGSVRSVVVEIALKSDRHNGALVAETDCYVQWRVSSNEAAGVGRGRGGA